MWPTETSVFVTLVPMLAPMTIGIAPLTSSAPPATRPTAIEVVVDELWTRLVARMPMKRPTKGLEVVVRSCSANPRPKNLKESPISVMLTKNPYMSTRNRTNLTGPGMDCPSGMAYLVSDRLERGWSMESLPGMEGRRNPPSGYCRCRGTSRLTDCCWIRLSRAGSPRPRRLHGSRRASCRWRSSFPSARC